MMDEWMMDEFDKRFAKMQKYIPVLEAMMERLSLCEDRNSRKREMQLRKLKFLHRILTNGRRNLTIETLQKCEDVLQKLHNKIKSFSKDPGVIEDSNLTLLANDINLLLLT
ncbi:PREDICTED: mediator of RNA polymerase II transcription subunit 15-like [Trachymyrmex cornetzi]|uniref:ARC105/Med15 mediator subunit central domain-containing protein n=1 Tax=Trachymyrmex cornetzi TaxID=471704 RepID=A0A195EGG8_9HYME|nr:PREDICTED: mediator of RNA polymerase II transcription subunit 15-like [Trachymyrmex cornetzi]KYN27333.1 hypothetical protein ALC57_03677 [Trachymyrmex cornetzi]